MITTNQLKIGMALELEEGVLFEVLDFQHVKPGKGQAFVRTKLKNLKSGAVADRTFRAGEKVQNAHLEKRVMQYLYQDHGSYVFMDSQSYEQVQLSKKQIGEGVNFLKENTDVELMSYKKEPLAVELPVFVYLKVTDTVPGVKGDTVSGSTKPAKLETGAQVQVPLFINTGDVVKIDTRSGEYITRR